MSSTARIEVKEQRNDAVGRKRRGTRGDTRERLIEAAIDLIHREGVAAVSTVSVTQSAGFAQSSFYMHFRSVDECIQAAAEKVAAQARAFIAEHRRRSHEVAMRESETQSDEVHVAHFRAVLGLFLEERPFAELLLRYRHDTSPLGEVMRRHMEQIRADLLADALEVAQWLGIGDEHRETIALQVEFILATVMAAGEALLEGRFKDQEMVARELASAQDAIVRKLLSRLVETG